MIFRVVCGQPTGGRLDKTGGNADDAKSKNSVARDRPCCGSRNMGSNYRQSGTTATAARRLVGSRAPRDEHREPAGPMPVTGEASIMASRVALPSADCVWMTQSQRQFSRSFDQERSLLIRCRRCGRKLTLRYTGTKHSIPRYVDNALGPRMKEIKYLALLGPVGVASLRCTIASDRIKGAGDTARRRCRPSSTRCRLPRRN
jgi:hypothetical protein